MCGIAGHISFDAKADKKALKLMLKKLQHRGPDGEGHWSDKHVALGMRRLAIIDLDGGMQPLFNEDKSIVIVGNGEIYNYKQLNTLIKKKGHRPRTGSDIETIIHLYEEYGVDCVKKLTGMFAFALYDLKAEKVILARDRIGEKPLYYSHDKNQVVFASEFKSISQVVPISPDDVDLNAINLYFHYYYIPEPMTVVDNIKKLPASHIMTIDLAKKDISLSKYWDTANFPPIKYSNPIKTFKDAIKKSVNDSLVADVEIGVSLSGGLDSAAITALASHRTKGRIKGFTIGYEGSPASDERYLAAEVAKRHNLEHIKLELKTKDVVKHFPQLVYDCDDPIADIAGHGIYSVSKLAHDNGIKVLLGGLGGDELFWGYDWTRRATRNNYLNKNFDEFYNTITPYKSAKSFISRFTTTSFKNSIDPDLPWKIFQPLSKLRNSLDYGRHAQNVLRDIWLVSNCIALTDRLSMAANIELRSPFLNNNLVQSTFRSVRNTKAFLKSEGKYWYKKSISHLIPEVILNAPKRGFQPPIARWLYAIISEYSSLLNSGFLVKHKIINPWKILLLTYTWVFIPFYWYSIYQIIILEVWMRKYITH